MEQAEGPALPISDRGDVALPVHPYEIVTVRADYAKDHAAAAAGK
jgi:hypothetical protein